MRITAWSRRSLRAGCSATGWWPRLVVAAALLGGCGGEELAEEPAPAGTLEAPLRARGDRNVIVVRAEPSPPEIGELFRLRTMVTDIDGHPVTGAEVEVDARMPHHRHGMVTRPSHREIGGGAYLSEGMKLHMPGRWRLDVVVRDGEHEETLTLWIEQPPS